jgi:cobalamin synthase
MKTARPRRPHPRTRQEARSAEEGAQSTATRVHQHDEPRRRGSGLLAPLRWLGRRLSGLMRSVARHLPAPLRWLARLLAPGKKRGFGFWWLLATLAVAVALGLVVALLLSPVAGLIALLVVAIWALVRRRRKRGRPQ